METVIEITLKTERSLASYYFFSSTFNFTKFAVEFLDVYIQVHQLWTLPLDWGAENMNRFVLPSALRLFPVHTHIYHIYIVKW